MNFQIQVIEEDQRISSMHLYPSMGPMLAAAESMLMEATADLRLRLTAPGVEATVQVADTICTSLRLNSDQHQDEADEALIREFVAEMMRVL